MSRPYQVHVSTLSPRLAMLGLLALIAAGCEAAPEVAGPAILAPTDALMAQVTKVDVCHRNADGQYVEIAVADAAYDTHIAHGDGGVGDAVPGTPGYEFDAECQPQEVEAADCPCFSAATVAQAIQEWSMDGSAALSNSDYEGGFYLTILSTSFDPSIGAGWPLFEAAHREGYYPTCADRTSGTEMSVTTPEAAVCRSILLEYDS